MVRIETLRSLHIRPCKNGVALGDHGATAFLIGTREKPILVSARHVFSAVNNDTGQELPVNGAPDAFFADFPYAVGADGRVSFREIAVPVMEKTTVGHENALWWDHPEYGHTVDIAAVAFPEEVNPHFLTPIPQVDRNEIRKLLMPTTDVSAIGFPFSKTGPQSTAIWTTCSVASEYGTDRDLFFLVDGRTRQGQSGSPVIKFRTDGNLGLGGNITMNGIPASHFAGLYSGRINAESDIGRVWKPEVVAGLLR